MLYLLPTSEMVEFVRWLLAEKRHYGLNYSEQFPTEHQVTNRTLHSTARWQKQLDWLESGYHVSHHIVGYTFANDVDNVEFKLRWYDYLWFDGERLFKAN